MSRTGSDRVLLVGDLMIRGPVAPHYRQEDAPFHQVVQYLTTRGIVVANLEMPLSTRGFPMPKWSNLRSHPDVITDVREMGIDVVALANNHMLDYGPDALLDTLVACDRAGLPHCGAGANLEDALRPALLPVGARQVAVLSVATTLPVGSAATPDRPGIAPIRISQSFNVDPNLLAEQPGTVPQIRTEAHAGDQEIVCDWIRQLKRDGAFVVVMLHWGVPEHWLSPYLGLLAEYQRPLGYALIDAGADVICGHHSHTLHPIECHNGRPIFYSLGNFLFERPRAFMEPASFIIEIDLAGEPRIELTPVLLDDYGFPYLASGADAERVFSRLNQLSEPYGVQVSPHDGHSLVCTT